MIKIKMATKEGWIKRKERYGFSGCRNPEERKRKISENTKKALAKPEIKIKIIEDRKRRIKENGYINSPQIRKKLSDTWKRKWANGEVTEKQIQNCKDMGKRGTKTQFKKGHKVPESWREAVRRSRANQIFPKEDTKIELKLQGYLRQLGIEFYNHYYVRDIEHKYRCDMLIPSMNLVIEADGDYWHGNPNKYSEEDLSEKQKLQIERDNIRTKQLLEKGYKVIRIWENEIKKMNLNDFQEVLNGIEI